MMVSRVLGTCKYHLLSLRVFFLNFYIDFSVYLFCSRLYYVHFGK